MQQQIVLQETESGYVAKAQRFCGGYYDYETGKGDTEYQALSNLTSNLKRKIDFAEMSIENCYEFLVLLDCGIIEESEEES